MSKMFKDLNFDISKDRNSIEALATIGRYDVKVIQKFHWDKRLYQIHVFRDGTPTEVPGVTLYGMTHSPCLTQEGVNKNLFSLTMIDQALSA